MTPVRPPARARVLVVEDSSVFREMQALLLRQAGFGVWSFADPALALAEAARQPFELALVDYELPNMNGAHCMQALREVQPELPVIIVSGSLTLELVAQLTRQGAAGIFRKPTNPRVLLEKIHETLNRTAREAELRAGTDLQTGVSQIPFPIPEPSANQPAYEPRYVFGSSDVFRVLTHELWRARDFRSVLLMQGEAGSPFALLARELNALSIFRHGLVLFCEPGEFEPRRMSDLLAPVLLTGQASTLVVHGVDDFNAAQQRLLEELISLRGMFQPFSRRLRVIATAAPEFAARIDGGGFDKTLFDKLSARSLSVPSLAAMRSDIVVNARRLLRHQRTVDIHAPVELAPEAAAWLESQSWPRNYAQLTQTLFFSLRHASGQALEATALAAGARDYESDRFARAAGRKLLPTPSIEIAPASGESPTPHVEHDQSPASATKSA